VITGDLEIRRIAPEDWGMLKAIRLEALADSPTAFITTFDEANAYPDAVWAERSSEGSEGGQATFLAVGKDRCRGMAIGLDRSSSGRAVVAIVSVYVAPEVRRKGVGSALMDAVEAWATVRRAEATSLWVVDGNDRARGFYEARGYRATLDRQKISVPPVRWETRFELRLSG
jgi:GNAT superfamily N-acetyltransferase